MIESRTPPRRRRNEPLWAALNSQSLMALDERIYLVDIEEKFKTTLDTQTRAGYGRMISSNYGPDNVSITLIIMVKESDRNERGRLISIINGWATFGWLTLSTRTGQRIYAHCTKKADYAAFEWSETVELTFTAYNVAFWQDIVPQQVISASVTDGSAEIWPMGQMPCYLEADVLNSGSGTVNLVQIAANGKMLRFENLGLAPGKTLKIYYDDMHFLRAEIDGVGKLSCRVANSDDDVRLKPRERNQVNLYANSAIKATIYARGLYN